MKKETWQQFCDRIGKETTNLVEEQYQQWIKDNPKEFSKLQREEDLKDKIK